MVLQFWISHHYGVLVLLFCKYVIMFVLLQVGCTVELFVGLCLCCTAVLWPSIGRLYCPGEVSVLPLAASPGQQFVHLLRCSLSIRILYLTQPLISSKFLGMTARKVIFGSPASCHISGSVWLWHEMNACPSCSRLQISLLGLGWGYEGTTWQAADIKLKAPYDNQLPRAEILPCSSCHRMVWVGVTWKTSVVLLCITQELPRTWPDSSGLLFWPRK